MKLIVATQNKGKLREIRRILQDVDIEICGMDEYPHVIAAIEDGTTFAENAQKKAEAVVRQTGEMCLADDSGLSVACLGGRPGVYSARFAGENASDADNNALLLREMTNIPAQERQAAFCCVMALCSADGSCRLFEGRLEGEIMFSAVGDGGFGYDPLFRLTDDSRSLAQISLDEKNTISHRGIALRQVVAVLQRCKDVK